MLHVSTASVRPEASPQSFHQGAGLLACLVANLLALDGVDSASAQGTLTFNYPWLLNGTAYTLTYYDSSGMLVRVIATPPQINDTMALIGVGLAGHVNNGTPHMEFSQTPGYSEYVVLSLTNGSLFGVTSVDPADVLATASRWSWPLNKPVTTQSNRNAV